jgi:hypothetical protein
LDRLNSTYGTSQPHLAWSECLDTMFYEITPYALILRATKYLSADSVRWQRFVPKLDEFTGFGMPLKIFHTMAWVTAEKSPMSGQSLTAPGHRGRC